MKKWAVILFLFSGILFMIGTICIVAGSYLTNYTVMKLAYLFYFLGVTGSTISILSIIRKNKDV